MKFGICTGPENAQLLKSMGFDYIEGSLAETAKMTKEEISEKRKLFNGCGIKMNVTNMFFPGDIKLAGESANINQIRNYVCKAFDNASHFGVKTCVLGSGGARRIPDGYDFDKGYNQVLEAVKVAGEIAQGYEITIAIEPLNSKETNIFTTVAESLEACKKLNLENVCVLADIYHMFAQKEDFSILPVAANKLHHIHFCNPVERMFPSVCDNYDYTPFISALKQAGYKGKISIEAHTSDIAKDGVKAINLLKQIFSAK